MQGSYWRLVVYTLTENFEAMYDKMIGSGKSMTKHHVHVNFTKAFNSGLESHFIVTSFYSVNYVCSLLEESLYCYFILKCSLCMLFAWRVTLLLLHSKV